MTYQWYPVELDENEISGHLGMCRFPVTLYIPSFMMEARSVRAMSQATSQPPGIDLHSPRSFCSKREGVLYGLGSSW